jgi:hypothetical protein
VTTSELLEDLDRRGIALVLEGEGLRAWPASQLSPGDRGAIRAHKTELLALLQPSFLPWDQAEAERLLTELRAEAAKVG